MSGTDIVYDTMPCAGISQQYSYAMPGTDLATDIAYGTACLRACYAMSGTHIDHTRPSYAMSDTDVASRDLLLPGAGRGHVAVYSAIRRIVLPSTCCYAMCGTDIAYAATGEAGSHSTSAGRRGGCDPRWYLPTRSYAMSGTDIGYDAGAHTRCPVLT
eukprot:3940677-Rhodomonas_salina.2